MSQKVGDVFTVSRELFGATGYSYYLTKLEGGLALVGTDTEPLEEGLEGGMVKQTFTFACLEEGKAAYQLAMLRVFDPSNPMYEEVMPVEITGGDSQSNAMPGGWTDLHELSKEEKKVFDEALEGFVGVGYTPKLVKSQVVNGVNYIYIANAQPVYPGGGEYKVQIFIYKPIRGKAVIKDITPLLG